MLIVQLAAQEKRSTTTGVETHPEEEEEVSKNFLKFSEKIFVFLIAGARAAEAAERSAGGVLDRDHGLDTAGRHRHRALVRIC